MSEESGMETGQQTVIYIAECWHKHEALHVPVAICATQERAKEECEKHAKECGITITKWSMHPEASSAITSKPFVYYEINPKPLLGDEVEAT